ncbi:hypothetical protein [Enteractinococcus helveticum]|uniref:Uncharacterized protein n=1 Tax=Enteractinococcus helveticum TaxID=1837282 RepID=A0A1B7LVL7_9MICC|nr:hypothetical protein [Enteractinococcus helveticum]OAV53974.1 hypothetical protein A6F49_00505 [Enteractinococcus helveticum]
MDSSPSASRVAELLLAGPRGRRLLLEYALASELAQHPVRSEDSFGQAVIYAAHWLDPDVIGGRALRMQSAFGWFDSLFGDVAAELDIPEVTATEVAERLGAVELLEPTPVVLRNALVAAVDSARYWQEPDGADILASTPEMSGALQRVAHHITAPPHTTWWCTPVDISAQYALQWEDILPKTVPDDVHAALLTARRRERAEEHIARTERDPDPTANWSGEWGSHPPLTLPSSTRLLGDGSPAGLWLVEDSLGWEQAVSVELIVPKGMSVFEIENAADWAKLCARFPIEVTAQKRHDWFRTTGRAGRWVVPDWVQVAEHYDGVHLQVGAYLGAAGVAIPVDDSTGTASVIAGWNPDETYWFSSDIAYDQEHIQWVLVDAGADMVWKPAST